jgi:DNA/RNA endonuclease G (NUC1)/V8-like Glu-specific endopeptidase
MSEHTERLKSYLGQILPSSSLEAMADEGISFEKVVASGPVPPKVEKVARSAVEKLALDRELDREEQFALEAIIIPDKRPAVDIIDGDFRIAHELWKHFNTDLSIYAALRKVIASIGRIELPDHPSLPYGGTGFVVGTDLIMTNRHVAEIFSTGLGIQRLAFLSGLKVGLDFRRERDRDSSTYVDVEKVVMIHPHWDMALLKVSGLSPEQSPLELSTRDPEVLMNSEVAVVGYPAFDARNDAKVQDEVFGGIYNVKRLQPGRFGTRDTLQSFGKQVSAATHDSSTLGGNSGSAVLDPRTGQVVALHFAGVYLKANYGVPSSELACDGHVIDAGVKFEPGAASRPDLSGHWWRGVSLEPDPQITAPKRRPAEGSGEGQALAGLSNVTQANTGTPAPSGPAAGGAPAAEKPVAPIHDPDYGTRLGYDPDFLGSSVKLPRPSSKTNVARLEDGGHVLPYHHFSIVMHKRRRMALFTASNVSAEPAVKRPEEGKDYRRKPLGGLGPNDTELWFEDPRIPKIHQLPDRFFAKDGGAFDRGHLVRREDVAWGRSFEEVRFANGDTFHTTNCSPQIGAFNRPVDRGNWGKLENFVLEQAEVERLCVFAGPVLSMDDRAFAGVDELGPVRIQIPSQYWKVVVGRRNRVVQSFGFLLRQDLSNVPLEFQVDAAWREHMISISNLEKLIGLVQFPAAVRKSDQAMTALGDSVMRAAGIRRIGRPECR